MNDSKSLRKMFKADLHKEMKRQQSPMHRAFIHWFLSVRFGTDARKEVTDGPADGGIDAIVVESRPRGKAIWIVQSKFTDKFFDERETQLAIDDYLNFDSMPSRFDSDGAFEAWLATVSPDLQPRYRELRQQLTAPGTVVGWQLVTLSERSRSGEDRLQRLTPEVFVYGAQCLQLYLMSREGATPPADPLDLHFTKSMTVDDRERGVTSYVFAANLKDFVDFMDHDTEERLFARNVRLDLKSKINKRIRQTYLDAPHEFWYSHNGITVVCTKAAIEGQQVRLVNPSVINGSQTLHALRGVPKRDADAQVLTRVLVVKPEDADHPTRKFVNDVVFRMNQQNPMRASNLRSNDDVQVALAGQLAVYRVFYERREGEWASRRRVLKNQGFHRLRSRDLAQVLAACDSKYGPVVAKGKIDRLFDEPAYDDLFYSPFPEIRLKWLLYTVTSEVIWETKIRGTKPKQRRQAGWAVLSIIHECFRRSPAYAEVVASPAATSNLWGWSDQTTGLWELAEAVLKDAWAAWVLANRKDRQLDPNNFFKADKHIKVFLAKCVRKYAQRADKAAKQLLRVAKQ
jgi:hypothetical protein